MGGKGHCGPVPTDTLDATAADRASGPDSTSQGPADFCGVLTILTARLARYRQRDAARKDFYLVR
ncbi:hypothetical protein SAMN05446589_1561 [Streptomyces sp. OV198]|jgi:hypothetical protein|nr:hypothetical protein SAMN05446589_1561 [Streptomyces sp. OV198]